MLALKLSIYTVLKHDIIQSLPYLGKLLLQISRKIFTLVRTELP